VRCFPGDDHGVVSSSRGHRCDGGQRSPRAAAVEATTVARMIYAFSAVERRARKQEAAGDQARARQGIDADFRCGRRLGLVGPPAVTRTMLVP
jgi:hypothetical protein